MLKKDQVIDRYRVEDLLGSGGMATVYKVRHNQLNSLHALKLLFITSPEVRRRLIREGRVQASLRHPNIVAVTDVLEVEGVPALVMEYVDGPVMDEWLFANTPSFETALRLFRGIVLAIAHAHTLGVVHRDLKTANILLAKTNDGLLPRVMDFGLMKAVGEKSGRDATRGGMAMGTPNYMSPEQITDASTVDERTDIFALGCILYELFAGKHAFVGDSPWEIYSAVIAGKYIPIHEAVPGVPGNVRLAIESCLKHDRNERLQDCEALFDMLYERTTNTSTALIAEETIERAIRLQSIDGSIPRAPALGAPSSASLDSRFDSAERRFENATKFDHVDTEEPTLPPVETDRKPPPDPTTRRWPAAVGLAVLFVVGVLAGRTFFGGAPTAQPAPAPAPPPILEAPPFVAAAPSEFDPVGPFQEDPEPAKVSRKRIAPKSKPTMATVTVKGDAVEVWLKGGGTSEYPVVSSARVPAGTYQVYAVFEGSDALVAGWLEARAGRKIVLTCASSNFRCTHK